MFEPSSGLVPTPFGYLSPIINDGTAQALILLSLQSSLKYGMEFEETKPWPSGVGQTQTIARVRPRDVDEEALEPGQDPVYKGTRYEQMSIRLAQYAEADRVFLNETALTVVNDFMVRWMQIGLGMAKKLNAVRRRILYSAYEGGHAIANDTQGGATALPVSTICGFTHHLTSDGMLQPVSGNNPKRIRIGVGDAAVYANVIAVSPADALIPFGRGTLTLEANTAFTAGDPVRALDASHRVYVNGAVSVDGITKTSWLTLASLRDARAFLEIDSVPTHMDGTYWVHLSPTAKTQLWADPEFQNLIRGQKESISVVTGVLGVIDGFTFISNNLVPRAHNSPSGLQLSRPVNFPKARLSKSFFNEVINKNGIEITHTLITGGGLGMTYYVDPNRSSPEQFGVPIGAKVQNGMTITMDNVTIVVENQVRFLMAQPRDDLRQWMPINGLFMGGFVINSDYYGGSYSDSLDLQTANNPRFKRAVTVVHYGT